MKNEEEKKKEEEWKQKKLGVESVKIGKPTALWLNGEWNRKISL